MKRLLFTFLTLILAFLGTSNAYASIIDNVDFENLTGGSYFNANYNLDLNTPLYYYTCPNDQVFPDVTLNYESGFGYNAPLALSTNFDGCYREYFQGSFAYYNDQYSTYISADKLGDANGNFVDMGNVGTCGNYYFIPDPFVLYDPYIGIMGVHNYVERLPAEYPVNIYKFHNGGATGWLGNYETKINISAITVVDNVANVTGIFTRGFNASSTMDTYNNLVFSFYGENNNIPLGTYTLILNSRTLTDSFDFSKTFNIPTTEGVSVTAFFKNSTTASTSEILGCGVMSIFATATTTEINNINSCNPFAGTITTLFLNSDFNLSDCLGDIGLWLVKPTDAVMNDFVGIKELIQTKPPFGYFIMLKDLMQNATTTGTATTSVSSITIPTYLQTYIFTPIKIGLASLIGFIGLVFLFRRLKHIQL